MNSLETNQINKLEALLYNQGGDLSVNKMLSVLNINNAQLQDLCKEYNLTNRGLMIINDNKVVSLRVAGDYASIVEQFNHATVVEDLSKASLEVLSVVLYKGSATASDIDYIRGVNSGYTLRQLTVRGMLNKSRSGMSYEYTPSVDLLAYLGITDVARLPQRGDILKKLQDFERQKDDRETN